MMKAIFKCIILFLPVTGDAASTLTHIGDLGRFGIPATAAVITAVKKDQTGLGQLSAGVGASVASTGLLKKIVDESRPDKSSNNSFPSGHATWAFSGAFYLQKRYGWRYGAPAIAAASVVAYSRVKARRHHVHDVLAGAAIGYGFATLFTDFNQSDKVENKVAIFPSKNGFLLNINLKN